MRVVDRPWGGVGAACRQTVYICLSSELGVLRGTTTYNDLCRLSLPTWQTHKPDHSSRDPIICDTGLCSLQMDFNLNSLQYNFLSKRKT